MATPKADTGFVLHRVKALSGQASGRGVDFDPQNAPPPAAPRLPAGVVRRPRPAQTRYPVDWDTYRRLKERADFVKPASDERAATVVRDTAPARPDRTAPQTTQSTMPQPEVPSPEPIPGIDFAGFSTTGYIPPDCTLAVGQQHILAAVNGGVAIFDKAGGAPLVQHSLHTWFANVLEDVWIFDPRALYDQHHDRWILMAVALPQDETRRGSWFLLSTSKSADPLAGWWNYALDAMVDGNEQTRNWADFPGLGVDNAAIYMTANMFEFDGVFKYAKIRIIAKGELLAGQALRFWDFVGLKNANRSLAFTVQPCHTFGASQVQYFVNSLYPTSQQGPTRKHLALWSITGIVEGAPRLARRVIATEPYGIPPDAVQPDLGQPLDTGDVRVLNAVFRGGSVWIALTTRFNFGSPTNVAAAHWFQIDAASGRVIQQGIFGARQRDYFYPVVMPDGDGNMMLCFASCSATELASIHYTGRRSTDPPGQLQPSLVLKAGMGVYNRPDDMQRNRWGDYAGIACDPADNKAIWFHNQFATDNNNWATWIGYAQF